MDLRRAHAHVAHATVMIRTRTGYGSGWLLAQSGRPIVITNRHVVPSPQETAEISFYIDSERPFATVTARVWHRARDIDLAILRLDQDPPREAEPLRFRTDVSVVRGQRVVLGGNPSAGDRILPFQTTEGVVTGHVTGGAYRECGVGRNCVVIDAASVAGSSGGPAVNTDGQLVGMLWGGPSQISEVGTVAGAGLGIVQNPTLAYLIHARVIADELRRLETQPTR